MSIVYRLHGSMLFQVKNSNHMEPEGLRRCLNQVLTEDDMDVGTLATDRHVMIRKMMKDDYPEVIMHCVCNHKIPMYHSLPFIMWVTARNIDPSAAVGEALYTLTIKLSSTLTSSPLLYYKNTGIQLIIIYVSLYTMFAHLH